MIEVGLPPEVVAAEVEKLATEGSLRDVVQHVSRRRVGEGTWLLEVCCGGGESGSMRAEFTVTRTPGGERSVIGSEPGPENGDSREWHASVERALWRGLAGLTSQNQPRQLASGEEP